MRLLSTRLALLWAVSTAMAALVPCPQAAAHEAPARDGLGKELVARAQKYIGMPYVWGGQGLTGFDCSGFVGYVYRQVGYTLPRVSRQQALIGLSVAYDALAPGDLLFFAEKPGQDRIAHVAISLGGNKFIHAALGRGAVSYDHLGEHYYASRLVAARRLLALPPGNYATVQGLAPAHLAAATPKELQALTAAYQANPRQPAALTALSEIPADMLMEHAGAHLPAQLMIIGGKQNILGGQYDGFEPASWAPEETSLGLRVGVTHAPTNTPGFALLQGNLLVVPWGLQAALRMPFLWPMWGPTPRQSFAYVPWHTARQWGRLMYGASLGTPGAKLYIALDRTAVLNVGFGLVMRHFVPSAASSTVDDLLTSPNPLSLTAETTLSHLGLRAVIDDVLAPRTLGAGVQYRPEIGGRHDRLKLSMAWAADVHASTRGMVPAVASGRRAIHGLELGASVLAWDGAVTQLRPYVALASLQTTTARRPFRVGAAVGATWALYHGLLGGGEHTITLRGEARFSQPGFTPSYFGFGYAAARISAFGHSDANPAVGGPSKLAVLVNQEHGPGRITGFGEVQYALARRLQLGLRYEDGGPTHKVPRGIFNPSDRSLSVYAGMHNTQLWSKNSFLHLHALWHAEQVREPWPGHRASSEHAYTQITSKLDVTSWLDVVVSVLHPLGAKAPGTRAWVSSSSINGHFNF